MARYVIRNTMTDEIVNAIEWDGDGSKWAPPAGHEALLDSATNVGDFMDANGNVTKPPAPPPPPEKLPPTTRANLICNLLHDKGLLTNDDLQQLKALSA